MFKRILILLTVSFQLSLIGFLNNESIISGKSSIFIEEVCYTEILTIEDIRYLYEYACDGRIINITQLED